MGVNESRYYPVSREEQLKIRKELGFTSEQKIILSVGELLPNKNQKMAIHMMQEVILKFPDALLLMAGNGPEKENLEREIQNCGLQWNVKMLGYSTCLEKYQRIADLLVACSKREGLPLNLVEAMLSGNPVVATQNRGHRELIHDGENGYLVEVNDVKTLSDKVIDLLNSGKQKAQIKNNAIMYAKQYGVEAVKSELGRIYFPAQ